MMSYTVLPPPTFEDWLRGWKEWARTRKRGKMAQFIVDKLEDGKQAHWMDISMGKFELTEWHAIADEWFKEKPRNSDQVDAPCMLRKGLPRAFPGLEEIKAESIKEGTQYRSRVFIATQLLVQEVLLHVNNKAGLYPDLTNQHNSSTMPTYNTQMTGMYMTSFPATTSAQQPSLMNGGFTDTSAHYAAMGGVATPQQLAQVKVEDGYNMIGSPGSDTSSPYSAYSYEYKPTGYVQPSLENHHGSALDSAQLDQIAHTIVTTSPYSTLERQSNSPYSATDTASPNYANPASVGQMLQVPPEPPDVWSSGGSCHGGSPRYSPEPTQDQLHQFPVDMPQHSPVMIKPSLSPQAQPEAVQVRVFPTRSPLEGGEQLCILFPVILPEGNKWISFVSQTRADFTTTVEAYQENINVLTTIIPKHHIAETVLLQVICNGQVLAQTDFQYFGDAHYNSDLLYQFLSQNMPSYFQQADLSSGGFMDTGGTGGGSLGYPYMGGIPGSTYGLLLGACRLGLEPFVYATLQLPIMEKISSEQLRKASLLAEEHHHGNLSRVLRQLVAVTELTVRGGQESKPPQYRDTLDQLDKGGDSPKDTGTLLMGQLVAVAKQSSKPAVQQEEKEQEVPGTPVVEPSTPVATEPEDDQRQLEGDQRQPRRTSSGRLRRQEKSVHDDDAISTSPPSDEPSSDEPSVDEPSERHGRPSLEEVNDQLPPLVGRARFNTGSFRNRERKMLISTHSDADSAVSMSFDREEFEMEILRRSSSSICTSGLFSLNADQGVVNVSIDADAGYTFASALQYECCYVVTEDYPPGQGQDNTIFKAGDRIVAIADTATRDKSPDDFADLLQKEATKGTTVKIVPRLSPPPQGSAPSSMSLDAPERRLVRRQSDQQLLDAITMKVSNLLSMKCSGAKRSVVIPHSGEGYGIKMIGGNAVGLFVSEVRSNRKEVAPGDQILEINGHDTHDMRYYEAMDLLRSSRDKLQLVVMENCARFATIRDQFEFDSFYLRSHINHAPSDSKDMKLRHGSLVRVVNTILYGGNYWLAWSVDEATGMDTELRKIPSPSKAKHQYGKDAYEIMSTKRPTTLQEVA